MQGIVTTNECCHGEPGRDSERQSHAGEKKFRVTLATSDHWAYFAPLKIRV